MNDKLVMTMQDISCFGQCSITVSLPIISACGFETAILPSSVLSTHTGGFKNFTFRDLTNDIPGILNHWKSEGISFDCIYTGYLGSIRQIELAKSIFKMALNPCGLIVVDPAMADSGRLYYGFTPEFVAEMATLCSYADIILPNITEACFMCGIPFLEGPYTPEYVNGLISRLEKLGAKKIILKGVCYDSSLLGVVVYDCLTKERQEYFTQRINQSFHGTGDCFASVVVGSIMNGRSLFDSAKLATDFVVRSIHSTMHDENHVYGVKFEKNIPYLIKQLNL